MKKEPKGEGDGLQDEGGKRGSSFLFPNPYPPSVTRPPLFTFFPTKIAQADFTQKIQHCRQIMDCEADDGSSP